MRKRKITFPHFGNYGIPIEHLLTRGLEMEYIAPPPMTKRTLELGSKHSPDYVCAPFKIHLGCFLEAIEQGADTLIQTGGVCRLGFYGELHELIISDLGYDVDFINLAGAKYSKPLTFYNEFRRINPDLSLKKVTSALLVALQMVEYMDEADDYLRKNIGFERENGSFEEVNKKFLDMLRLVEDKKELKKVYNHYMKMFRNIPLDKPKKPLRVGIIGEYYTIMEPFTNHYLEYEMAKMGVMVNRWMNVSNSILHFPGDEVKENISRYSKYNMGATTMPTIDRALKLAKRGYDGLIHVKSFGCTPETDAMPVLQNISEDYKIPILYLSLDTQTADTGLQTRLEAFYDMMKMRKGQLK